MDKNFLEGQKKRLEKEAKKLDNELKEISKKQGSLYSPLYPNYGSRDDENAAEVNAYETHLGIEKDILNILNKTKEALKRIKEGSYGICENCREIIDKKRLEVIPQAEFCLKCAAKKR